MINNIINTINNLDNFQKLTLILIALLFIIQYRMSSNVEKMVSEDGGTIREAIKDIYQADVMAIKNLGDLAKKIYDNNGRLVLPHDVEIKGGKLIVSNEKGHERCIISGVGGKTAAGGDIQTGKDIIVIPEQNGGNPGLVIGMDNMSGFTKGINNINGNVNVNGNITNTGELNATNLNVSGNMTTKNISTTGDITATGRGQFGVAKIGTGWGGGAEFTHKDGFNTRNYTLRSYGTGDAFVNVPSGKVLYFRQNDDNKAFINSNHNGKGIITEGRPIKLEGKHYLENATYQGVTYVRTNANHTNRGWAEVPIIASENTDDRSVFNIKFHQ